MTKTDYTIELVRNNYITRKNGRLISQVNILFGEEGALHSIFIIEGANNKHFYHLCDGVVYVETIR